MSCEPLEPRALLTGTLFPGQQYNTGPSSQTVASGDFNNDNKPDLVAANQAGIVTVQLGNGDGAFGAPATYNVGSYTGGILAEDFNNDQKTDLCVIRRLGGVIVMLGDGIGGFGAPSTFATSLFPTSLVAGDFNGDSKLDVAGARDSSSGYVMVLLGDGSGSFSAPVTYAAGTSPNSIVTGDFTHDGKADLAVANFTSSGTVTVLAGVGDGSFATGVSYPVGPSPLSLATGDLNNDGFADLVAAKFSAVSPSIYAVSVLLGNVSATFTAAADVMVTGRPRNVRIADFNCDGKADLAVAVEGQSAEDSDTIWVMLGNGQGAFGMPTKSLSGKGHTSMTVADFMNDGIPDVATTNFSTNGGGSALTVLFGDGTGSLGASNQIGGGHYPTSITADDFNADGLADMAVANLNSGPGIGVFINNGDGTFAPALNLLPDSGCIDLASGDFDGDGNLDLVATQYKTTGNPTLIYLLTGNGDGTFDTAMAFTGVNKVRGIIVGDFDEDAHLDVAVTATSPANSVVVLLGDGAGGFSAPSTIASVSNPLELAAGDVNGDGHLDIIVASVANGNAVAILLGQGDGTFLTGLSAGVGNMPVSVVTADFNHDGHTDFATTNVDNPRNNLSVMLGNGDGTFALPIIYGIGYYPNGIVAADFDDDGELDLAAANNRSNNFSVLMGNGDGTFGTPMYFAAGIQPFGIVAADFDGDGTVDLATPNQWSDDVSVLLNQSKPDLTAPFVQSLIFDPATNLDVVVTFSEQLNPSTISVADLVVTELGSNQTFAAASVMLSSSNQVATFRFMANLPDGNYRIQLPAGAASDLSGNALAATSTLEGPSVFLLSADANRDRKVNTQDFNILAANFGGSSKVFSQGNFNYDPAGNVDSIDFDLFISQYGKTLPVPAPTLAMTAGPMTQGTAIFGTAKVETSVDQDDVPGLEL